MFEVGDRVRITDDETKLARSKMQGADFVKNTIGEVTKITSDNLIWVKSVNEEDWGSWSGDEFHFYPECLTLLDGESKPVSNNKLDSILESLYDHVHGKAVDNLETLLSSYKELTGKDKPGFMR